MVGASARRAAAREGDNQLVVEGVSKRFGGVVAVQDVSLEVPRGSIVSIIGPNGAGKTSLLNMISGFYKPDTGRIALESQDITQRKPSDIAALGVARTFQNIALFSGLTVLDNLRLGAHSRPDADHQSEIESLLKRFPRLRERLHGRAGLLSGGEQQMLSIARALLTNPSVLLMDEPTEGLAPVIVEALTAVLVRLRSESRLSIILVEQNSRVALEFSDRSVVMDKGRVVYDGASKALRDDPERLAQLIGVSE